MHLMYEMLKKTAATPTVTADQRREGHGLGEGPRGPDLDRSDTRDIIQNVYIRKVEKKERRAVQRRIRDLQGGQGSVKAAEKK